MHRIAATPGGWNPDTDGVIFIEQTPAPIIFLTAWIRIFKPRHGGIQTSG